MEGSVLQRIEEMQRLTRDYASYTRRRSGLGTMLGGIITLVIALLLLFNTPDRFLALAVPGLTLTWLIGKERLRMVLYTPLGKATERWLALPQRYHLWRMCLGTLLLAGIMLCVVVHQHLAFQHWWPLLVFLLMAPWIVWRSLRNWMEYLLGLFLLLASALTSIGQSGDVRSSLIVAFLLALLGILLGLTEHLRFRRLVDEVHRRHQNVLSQRLLYPLADLAPGVRSAQSSWRTIWSVLDLPWGYLLSLGALGMCPLVNLLQILALHQPLALFPPPMVALLLLCVDEAFSERVALAYAGQGGSR